MNSKYSSLARIVSTGFMVCMFFSILLFWANAVLRRIGKEELVTKNDLGLHLAIDLGNRNLSDPNMDIIDSIVICDVRSAESDILLDHFFESQYWATTGYDLVSYPWRYHTEFNHAKVHINWHTGSGLIVIEEEQPHLKGKTLESRIRYVGPKGFSGSPDIALGRFSNPQLCSRAVPSTLFVHDTDLKVFFRIDAALETVRSESWAEKSIVTTSGVYLSKFGDLLEINAYGGGRWETDEEMHTRLEKEREDLQILDNRQQVPVGLGMQMMGMDAWGGGEENASRKKIPFGPRIRMGSTDSGPWAMDDQGTIYLIDRDTLLLSPPKGQLPRCGKEKTHTPSQLIAYRVSPLFADEQYLGLVAVSLSRDGSNAVMALFDSKGRVVDRNMSQLKKEHYQYGRVTSAARSVLDFAQPLVFSVASSLWGSRIEAIVGYRSLFVLPLSTPARIAGDRTLKVSDRVGTVIMWNVFTWCVGLLLAIAVIRDLKQRGHSSKIQNAWLFACMGFGWIAVITYLLTRPRTHFVTCTGCGRTRRTDQADCQHCEADWAMRDLQVPVWRVVG